MLSYILSQKVFIISINKSEDEKYIKELECYKDNFKKYIDVVMRYNRYNSTIFDAKTIKAISQRDRKDVLNELLTSEPYLFENSDGISIQPFVDEYYNPEMLSLITDKRFFRIKDDVDNLIVDKRFFIELEEKTKEPKKDAILNYARWINKNIDTCIDLLKMNMQIADKVFKSSIKYPVLIMDSDKKLRGGFFTSRINDKILAISEKKMVLKVFVHETMHMEDKRLGELLGDKNLNISDYALLNKDKILLGKDEKTKNMFEDLKTFIHGTHDKGSLYKLPKSSGLLQREKDFKEYAHKIFKVDVDKPVMDIKSSVLLRIWGGLNKDSLKEYTDIENKINNYLDGNAVNIDSMFSIVSTYLDYKNYKGMVDDFYNSQGELNNASYSKFSKINIYYRRPTEMLARIIESKIPDGKIASGIQPLGSEKRYLVEYATKITSEFKEILLENNKKENELPELPNGFNYTSFDFSVKSAKEKLSNIRKSEIINNRNKVNYK